MKGVCAIFVATLLCVGLVSNAKILAGVIYSPPEEVLPDQQFNRLRNFAIEDAVPFLKEKPIAGDGFQEEPHLLRIR